VLAVEGAPDNAEQAGAPALPALPFADSAFQLVTNRHESFVAAEVARVLEPGGQFITQQVASNFNGPMRALMDAPNPTPPPRWDLALALDQVRAAGLEVIQALEGDAQVTFADVGALAWYLLHVPWVLPEFEIAAFRDRLAALHETAPITVPQPHFWLQARRAA
jgi:SAM-dependent methyltransferase